VTDPLRVLVYPHAMEVGGSQLNAIELAAAVRDLGHDVTIVSEEGALMSRVAELSLAHLPLPQERRRPSASVVRQLRDRVRGDHVDVVHGYEWPPGLEAAAAVLGRREAAAVCTVMSMAVAPFLPRSLPLVVGTRAIQQQTQLRRSGPVHLIEPPVDVRSNAPGVDTDEFRARFGLERTMAGTGEPIVDVVVVCRLVPELKLEGVLTAVDVVGDLARHRPVRLIVVGDGSARDEVAARTARANERAGRAAVVCTGELLDPRPAYAAADIMLGMGGSALRALAFGRPLVVQGERGFWELLTPDSLETFLHQGWFGLGDGRGGAERLTAVLVELLDAPQLRASLGRFGRDLAVDRFSLEAAAKTQEDIYRQALATPHRLRPGTLIEMAQSASGLLAHKIRQRHHARRGTGSRDDFNAAELAGAALSGGRSTMTSPDRARGGAPRPDRTS
jgi:glycosyltransferase involved in cell wall biosynthesis